MKKLIAGLCILVTTIAFAAGSTDKVKVRPYKWIPIPGVIIHGARAYIDMYSLRTAKTDSGVPYNAATLLTTYDEPITVTSNKGNSKSGSSVISYVIIDCESGVGGAMRDFLLVEKMPTKESIPIAEKKYAPTPENTFHFDKDNPMLIALCPEEI